MTRKHVKLSDQVRWAVDESGMSRYAICKATGIDQGLLSCFMAGTKGLSIRSLDVLAEVLELDIAPRRKRGRRAR